MTTDDNTQANQIDELIQENKALNETLKQILAALGGMPLIQIDTGGFQYNDQDGELIGFVQSSAPSQSGLGYSYSELWEVHDHAIDLDDFYHAKKLLHAIPNPGSVQLKALNSSNEVPRLRKASLFTTYARNHIKAAYPTLTKVSQISVATSMVNLDTSSSESVDKDDGFKCYRIDEFKLNPEYKKGGAAPQELEKTLMLIMTKLTKINSDKYNFTEYFVHPRLHPLDEAYNGSNWGDDVLWLPFPAAPSQPGGRLRFEFYGAHPSSVKTVKHLVQWATGAAHTPSPTDADGTTIAWTNPIAWKATGTINRTDPTV